MVHLFSFYRLIAHQKEIAHTSAVEWARTIHSYERTHTHTYVLHIWNVPQIRMYTQVVTLEIDWYVPCDHYNSYGVFYFISSFCFAFRTIQIKTTTHTCCSISKSFRPIKRKKMGKKRNFSGWISNDLNEWLRRTANCFLFEWSIGHHDGWISCVFVCVMIACFLVFFLHLLQIRPNLDWIFCVFDTVWKHMFSILIYDWVF